MYSQFIARTMDNVRPTQNVLSSILLSMLTL